MLDVQVDGVGRQCPVRAGRLPFTQRLDELDLAVLERELDARAEEGVAARGVAGFLAGDPGFPQQHAEPGGLVHHQRVGSRGEVAAVDRHVAAAPHAVIAAEAHAIGDDDVRLGGVRGRAAAIVDRGPLRGDHLHGVAHAGNGAVIREVRAAKHGVVAAVDRYDSIVRLEVFIAQVIRRQVRVEDQQRITYVHVADHVEALLAPKVLNAVGSQGGGRAVAVGPHPAPAVVIRGVTRGDLTSARQAIDGDDAGPALGGVGRGGVLHQDERQQEAGHCLGNTKRPPVPVIWWAWMFLKSGSDVKPTPLRCWLGASRVKSRSELTSLRA